MKTKQIALFGGTFDPIHNGHTVVAADAAARLDVAQLIFIPARQSPLKVHTPSINDRDRVHLIELAIADNPLFTLSTCELERPVPSYTLDTVRLFRRLYDDDTKLFWLIGADGVSTLAHWYKIQELVDVCTIVTMFRAGCPHPDFSSLVPVIGERKVAHLQQHTLPTPAIPFSSTDVRERIRLGNEVESMLHPAVQGYIEKNGLYR
jgi:nicotinate-nucleotide adenylyltransferase